MALRKVPFSVGEWYHAYSRGLDKRTIFESDRDYKRFQQYLYLSNTPEPLRRDNLERMPHHELFSLLRSQTLVSIGAYCLMPNHFHLLLNETTDGGITRFMQKLGTAYTMYFNIKYERVGGLLTKPFRAKHIADDRHFQHVAQYIHLNSAELSEPGFKRGKVRSAKSLINRMQGYRYSSFPDYCGENRAEKEILDAESFDLLSATMPPANELIEDAIGYFSELRG